MDFGGMGIILTVVGIGLTLIGLGLTLIGILGNNRFNKLSSQIDLVETKLKGELSRINDEIKRLREQNVDRDIDRKIKMLEDELRTIKRFSMPKKGRYS